MNCLPSYRVASLVVALSLFGACGIAATAHAHGSDTAGDDHSAEAITQASAAAHLDLARAANEEAKTYVASLEDADIDAWRGSVPHLSHLARDLAAAEAAYDATNYSSAADFAQKVINHAPEIMDGTVLATSEMNFNQFAPTDNAHQGHGTMDMTPAVEVSASVDNAAQINALRAQVVELMNVLIKLLSARIAAQQ